MALFSIEVFGRVEVIHKVEFPEAAILAAISNLKDIITMNQQQTNEALTAINASLTEASTEIGAKLQELQDSLANAGNLTPENEALINTIRAKAAALADVVPGSPEQPAG